MKPRYLIILGMFAFFLNGCAMAQGIFEAGMAWVFFIVAFLLILLLWALLKSKA